MLRHEPAKPLLVFEVELRTRVAMTRERSEQQQPRDRVLSLFHRLKQHRVEHLSLAEKDGAVLVASQGRNFKIGAKYTF